MRYAVSTVVDAIRAGTLPTVRAYLRAGGDPERRDEMGSTLLHIAVLEGKLNIVSLLLRHGAQANATDAYGNTPMHIACLYGLKEIAELLLQYGADIDSTSDLRPWTPLMLAVNENYTEMVEWLLTHGANPNHVDVDQGWTPLLIACDLGLKDLTLQLLERGVRVDVRVQGGDARGRSALHLASYYGEVELVRALLQQGVDVNQQPEGGGLSALHWAVYNEHLDLIEFLLAQGADVNIRASGLYQQRAPLHFAVAARSEHMAVMLLEVGANPLQKDAEDQSPLDIALMRYREGGAVVYERLWRLLESYI